MSELETVKLGRCDGCGRTGGEPECDHWLGLYKGRLCGTYRDTTYVSVESVGALLGDCREWIPDGSPQVGDLPERLDAALALLERGD